MSYQDQRGNPARQTDEYGNPVHHAGGTGTYGTTNTSGTTVPMTGSVYGDGQQQMHSQEHRGPPTTTNPKGLTEKVEKIRERIPGVGQKEHQGPTSHTVGQEYGTGQCQEKKGVTEKIKERIPGVGQHQGPTTGHQDQYGNPARQTDEFGNPNHHAGGTGPYGTTNTSGTTVPMTGFGYGEGQQQMRSQEHQGPITGHQDQYGNPARQTDEYGNPDHHAGGTGPYGTTNTSGTTVPMTSFGYGEGQQQMRSQEHQGPTTTTNPKKLTEKTEKIKGRIPGVGSATTITTPTSHTVGEEYGTGQCQEKKGVTEKIKEKIPGVGQHQGLTTGHQDQYGNPARQTEEYGNPYHHAGGTGTYGTTNTSGKTVPITGSGYGEGQQQMHSQEHRGPTTTTNPKGLTEKVEKIKERIPGVGQKEHQGPTSHTVGQEYGTGQCQEKNGVTEKIKEKIPGVGQHQGLTTGTTAAPTSQTEGQHYGTGLGQQQEKKGMMEKIKERIPGVGQKEHQGPTSHTVGQEYGTDQCQEKKGVTEKIKERIPGVGQHQGPTTGHQDEYGNPANQTDQYGNPVLHTGGTGTYGGFHTGGTGTYGTTYPSSTTTAQVTGSGYGEGQQPMDHQKHHGHQDQYGNPTRQTDEYGNPARQTDEYGNTVP